MSEKSAEQITRDQNYLLKIFLHRYLHRSGWLSTKGLRRLWKELAKEYDMEGTPQHADVLTMFTWRNKV
jgi:hypothetical protein